MVQGRVKFAPGGMLKRNKQGRMLDRMFSFVVALGLAVLVWLYARSRDPEVLDNVPIPVQVSLTPAQAEHYDLEVTGPAQVPVSFRGPPSHIRELRGLLQEGGLHVDVTVVVPDDRKNEGRYLDTVRIDAADVHALPGVTPLVMEGRNRLPITLRRLVQRRLPVRLDPAPEDRVRQVVIEPATVLVRGPKVILDRVRFLPTQPSLLVSACDMEPDQEEVAAGVVPLVKELDGRPVTTVPENVSVRLTYHPRERVYELTDVPIRFLCPADWTLRPRFVTPSADKVRLRLRGPADAEPGTVAAYLDLTARKFGPGLYIDEPLRLQLPRDFTLAQDPPRAAAFRLIGTEAKP